MVTLSSRNVRLQVNQAGGILGEVAFTWLGREVSPLYRAPWVDAPDALPTGVPAHLRGLAGDFFCAPFGKPDDPSAPAHGWSANGWWSVKAQHQNQDMARLVLQLDRTINGASLSKEIILRGDHPVVYQRHVFVGGTGSIPVAHHAMVHVPGGARLSFSTKDFGATPSEALHHDPAVGRSLLVYPQRFRDLGAVHLEGGATADIRTYPFADGHEDFLTLFEPRNARTGWSAALAINDGFLFFALKDASVLCQTSLWMSNRGRHDPPYSSRLAAVLGIEESCAHFVDGPRTSAEANDLSAEGYRTALQLHRHSDRSIRYAFGAIGADRRWSEVADISIERDNLNISDASGDFVTIPFDGSFFN